MNLSAISGMDTKRFSDRVEKALVETDKKLEYTANIITVLKNVMIYLGEWMDGTTETLSSIYDKTSFSEELSSLKEFVSEKLNLSDFEDNVYMQLKNIEAVGQNFVEQGEFMKQQISKFNQLEADIENLQNIVENTISQNELKADELQNIVEKAIAVQEQNVSDFKKDVVMAISQNELKIEELHTDIENRILKQDTRLDRIEKALDRIASVLESSSSNSDTIEKIEELDEKVTKLSSNIEKLAAYVE
jgi:ribosomal protein L17